MISKTVMINKFFSRPSIPVAPSFAPSSSSSKPLPPPITPALILHQGKCTGQLSIRYRTQAIVAGPNCPLDASMSVQSRDLGSTYITRNEVYGSKRILSLDKFVQDPPRMEDSYAVPHHSDRSPCPARQGDPCAPKPPCVRFILYIFELIIKKSDIAEQRRTDFL